MSRSNQLEELVGELFPVEEEKFEEAAERHELPSLFFSVHWSEKTRQGSKKKVCITRICVWLGEDSCIPVAFAVLGGKYSPHAAEQELFCRPGRFKKQGGWQLAVEMGLIL